MSLLPAESLDQLVELHVLTEHGDALAAARAASWIARDHEARRIWDAVEDTCRQLRAAEAITTITT